MDAQTIFQNRHLVPCLGKSHKQTLSAHRKQLNNNEAARLRSGSRQRNLVVLWGPFLLYCFGISPLRSLQADSWLQRKRGRIASKSKTDRRKVSQCKGKERKTWSCFGGKSMGIKAFRFWDMQQLSFIFPQSQQRVGVIMCLNLEKTCKLDAVLKTT